MSNSVPLSQMHRIKITSNEPSEPRHKPFLVYVDGERLDTIRGNGRRFATRRGAAEAGELALAAKLAAEKAGGAA